MKTILLLRHGKSDPGSGSGSDHDRPLAKRGRIAARSIGRFLALVGETPDLALSSSAVRARSTLEVVVEAGRWEIPVETERALYATSPDAALDRIRELDDGVASVLLVGHEPTWSSLASQLIGDAVLRFPTGALARIDFSAVSWREVDYGNGVLIWFVPPRLLVKVLPEE
jgi:phosphohistidine phosphatase